MTTYTEQELASRPDVLFYATTELAAFLAPSAIAVIKAPDDLSGIKVYVNNDGMWMPANGDSCLLYVIKMLLEERGKP